MAEEIDDCGFYREDFSTDSDWEVLSEQLIQIFQNWDLTTQYTQNLNANELFACKWKIETESLKLLNKDVIVQYYVASSSVDKTPTAISEEKEDTSFHVDLLSTKNTFEPCALNLKSSKVHPIVRFYGLHRFVVVKPNTRYLVNPAEFSFFMSAISVACNESGSNVPCFLQIFDPKWNYFIGLGLSPFLRTNFNVVAWEKARPEWRYLSSLLTIFKEKVQKSYSDPATISVRNIYLLDDINIKLPMQIPFSKSLSLNEPQTSSIDASVFISLPFGYFPNSSSEIYCIYIWNEIAENIAFDSSFRSDFVPSKAVFGQIYQTVKSTSYLSSCLLDYEKLFGNKEHLEEYLGKNYNEYANSGETSISLRNLTESSSALRFPQQELNYQRKKIAGPMNEIELNQMIFYLFPETNQEVALFPYDQNPKLKFDAQRIKSAPPDLLVFRLSCLLGTCNAHFGGKSGISQLWAAFTRELRRFWETGLKVTGVAKGFPDTNTCLLHQKLQMLNVCIERRKQREDMTRKTEDRTLDIQETPSIGGDDDDDDDDDDNDEDEEFFDCDEENASLNNKPEGRLKQLGDLKLLDCDEPLYIPMTQEPVPKTEDQLQEDTEIMLKLGPGSNLTTQMMCSSLLSDMEAFKAANPKGKMEDFIRWYSPKDWEETPEGGALSGRMTAPGNTWLSVWSEAQPMPAWRQKRLFDDTSEAVKVLQYLESRTIGDIYSLTIISLLHAAILKLQDIFESSNVFDLFSTQINYLLSDLCRLSRDIDIIRDTEVDIELPNPEPIIKQIKKLENEFYQFKCFEHFVECPTKMPLEKCKELFGQILKNNGNCDLATRRDIELGNCKNKLDLNLSDDLSDRLISKEYVIRANSGVAGKNSSEPQFMRATVTNEGLRLCGAFTESTTFI